jgi:hydroxypyruvate reductase
MHDLTTLRQHALHIFQAGVAAADPYQAVKRYLKTDGGTLAIVLDNGGTRTGNWSKVHVVAFGKAARAMAQAARDIIPARLLAADILVVTNYENVAALAGCEVIGAGHPLPDAAGLQAAQRLAERVGHAQAGELVLVLVSGGGSALIPCPVEPVSLQDKIATTALLLSSGAPINAINGVRKHLSRLKGGGLAQLALPAAVHALILSDVLGDDLSAIASGPTVADHTTYADAVSVLKNYAVWGQTPATVQNHLQQGALGNRPETPKLGGNTFKNAAQTLVGSNALSVAAMRHAARQLNYDTLVYSENLSGEAKTAAEDWVLAAQHYQKPLALVAGGETTVTLTGNGRGGRNQEMALAFAVAAEKHGLAGHWVFLSGGTDGRDGPTDAAGGIVDPHSLGRMRQMGADPHALLANNDAYHALKTSHDLLVTGATGTNVADLQVLLMIPNTKKPPSGETNV